MINGADFDSHAYKVQLRAVQASRRYGRAVSDLGSCQHAEEDGRVPDLGAADAGAATSHPPADQQPRTGTRVTVRAVTVLRQSVYLAVLMQHNVARVMRLLAPVVGIPTCNMMLSFNGRCLDPSETLASIGLTDQDVLLVRIREPESMQLSVCSITGERSVLVAAPTMRVADVKAWLESKIGIPSQNQMLLYAGARLENDDVTLRELGILRGPATMVILPSA